MKKITYLLVISYLFTACNSFNTPRDYTVVCGDISNPQGMVYLGRASGTNVEEKQQNEPQNGHFYFRVDSKLSAYYMLQHNREYTLLYLNPGDSVYITFDTKQMDESLKYSGIGASKDNYLAKWILKNSEFSSQIQENFAKGSAEYIPLWEQKTKEFEQLLADANTDKDFAKVEKKRLQIEALNEYGYFAFAHQNEPQLIDDFINKTKNEIDVNDPSMLDINGFESFCSLYLNAVAENNANPDESLYKRIANALNSEIKDTTIYRQVVNQMISRAMMGGNMAEVDELIENVNPSFISAENKTVIDATKAKWDKLKAGNPAPSFTATNVQGKSFTLNDFKGKPVYIDVWATWCGPCKREIPYLEQLIEKYGDKINFISVSVDENKDAWTNMVIENKLKANQLYIAGAWQSTICKDYNIEGIPRFILLDKNLNIINANADRPSGDIELKFEELIK